MSHVALYFGFVKHFILFAIFNYNKHPGYSCKFTPVVHALFTFAN